MLLIGTNNREEKNTKGFSLIELIIVISIIAILATIAVPSYRGYRIKAKEKVCNANSLQLERLYAIYLTLEDIEHSDTTFSQYVQQHGEDICLDYGEITFADGEVKCSIHDIDDEIKSNDEEDKSVPFL